jgi:glycine dehydrogenase
MGLLYRVQAKRIAHAGGAPACFVADSCFPQTIDVLRGRAEPLGIELIVAPLQAATFDARTFGAIVQTPDEAGCVLDLRDFLSHAKAHGVLVAVGTDLLSLALLTPPGEIGADVAFGSAQRFGVPMGYGGPHAAFCDAQHIRQTQSHRRRLGGRHGNLAYRMALQTRERTSGAKGDVQYLRRRRCSPTSQVCLGVSGPVG